MKYVEVEEFINQSSDIPVIDVRSPLEFDKGHINGAVNIPLFENHERDKVGTVYKQIGRLKAIETGLEFIGPKMKSLATQAVNLSERTDRLVYCWRGGMRSEKMAWLFELLGLRCSVLLGGYKSFRKKIHEDLSTIKYLFVLHGSTGCGKTEVLKELKNLGEQVIDLEGLAHHKGSAFGHIGQKNQPTSQQFQNDIFNQLIQFDLNRRIWVEAESLHIGNANLPDSLWQRMKTAIVVELRVDKDERVNRLVNEYGIFSEEDLLNSIAKIKKKLGDKRFNQSVEALKEKNLSKTAELLLDYYDRTYEFTRQRFRDRSFVTLESHTGNAEINARSLLNELHKKTIMV